jgi:photosystem II stability/assembly factor-like uncharacterized protein
LRRCRGRTCALGFADAGHGFLGNIGTDYFPGVTDPTPLYETHDGGHTWAPIAVDGPAIKGICAIDVLDDAFIDAGHLEHRTIVSAAGRVGGPAFLARSLDGGATWKSRDLSAVAGMILDVKFFDASTGFVFAGTDSDAERSSALILATHDGGDTWTEVYRSTRPLELIWKASFPTREVGYATVLSFDEKTSQRYVVKTVDGGKTWTELPLVDEATETFGIGFADADHGWVGGMREGFATADGGQSWTKVDLGAATNKIRVIPADHGYVAYAIGVDVHKLDARTP